MKTAVKLLLIITFIISFYYVGSFVVDTLMKLFPQSAEDWFPVFRFLLWVFTFTFNVMVTILVYFFTIYIISLLIPTKNR